MKKSNVPKFEDFVNESNDIKIKDRNLGNYIWFYLMKKTKKLLSHQNKMEKVQKIMVSRGAIEDLANELNEFYNNLPHM